MSGDPLDTPIFDELAAERGVRIPDQLDGVASLLPVEGFPRSPRHDAELLDLLDRIDEGH